LLETCDSIAYVIDCFYGNWRLALPLDLFSHNHTHMKQFIFYLLTLVICTAAEADPGPLPVVTGAKTVASTKAIANAGAVRFQFNHEVTRPDHADSVLVIFDRYDRTGAGVIYQLYAADSAQGIDVSNVPAGKYYVTIQFLGLHRDRMEKVITIKSKKSEKVRIDLGDAEIFAKDKVVIPAYRPDFSNLVVTR